MRFNTVTKQQPKPLLTAEDAKERGRKAQAKRQNRLAAINANAREFKSLGVATRLTAECFFSNLT